MKIFHLCGFYGTQGRRWLWAVIISFEIDFHLDMGLTNRSGRNYWLDMFHPLRRRDHNLAKIGGHIIFLNWRECVPSAPYFEASLGRKCTLFWNRSNLRAPLCQISMCLDVITSIEKMQYDTTLDIDIQIASISISVWIWEFELFCEGPWLFSDLSSYWLEPSSYLSSCPSS